MFLISHGGVIQIMGELRKNLWGRHFMLWGLWETVKSVGELEESWGAKKSMGESSHGGCYRGV